MQSRFIVLLVCAGLVLANRIGRAAEIAKPSESEVLEEIAKVTGLSKDVVGLVHAEHAKIFEGLDNLVFASKVVTLLTEAQDTKALSEVAGQGLEIAQEKILGKIFPVSVNVVFTAASAYQTSLELVRDYSWIPKWEDAIYQNYKKSRAGDNRMDISPEACSTAFNLGVMNSASGYYTVKPMMLKEMVKEKLKLNRVEDAGEHSVRMLEKQIDEFWIHRLEMKWQQERLHAQRDQVRKEIWAKGAQQLEAIQTEAARLGGLKPPESFFLTEKDFPQGWKRLVPDSGKDGFRPHRSDPQSGLVSQEFTLFNSKFTHHSTGWEFTTSDGKYIDATRTSGRINLFPRIRTYPGGSTDVAAIEKQNAPSLPGTDTGFKAEGIEWGILKAQSTGRSLKFDARFVKGQWVVWVLVNANPSEKDPGSIPTREFVESLAKTIADRIPATK